MKTLDIEETKTQYVIKPHGSNTARVVNKDDHGALAQAFEEMLAEAPEEKPQPQPEESDDDGSIDEVPEGLQDTIGGFIESAGELLKSPEAQKIRGMLEKLPSPKKKGKAG